MATIGQIRGAMLEEAVLFLLQKVGYKIVRDPSESIDSTDLQIASSGLELQGRGTWHQIDAVAEQHQTPAFMFPRLLVEAKFYTTQKVGVNVVRNAVGVHKDISENYFSKHREQGSYSTVRFNYQSAIFSVSGYTKRAVDYAVAHQVFLIEYKKIPVIEPVIQAINDISAESLTQHGMSEMAEVRKTFRETLEDQYFSDEEAQRCFTDEGINSVNTAIRALNRVGGSYFGMLQGRWPLHLLTQAPLPSSAFEGDTVRCRLQGNREGQWRFTPSNSNSNDDAWFELQFFLSLELAEFVGQQWGDAIAIAETKSQNFSFIALSGLIGNIWRNVRIELDENWLQSYLERTRT